VVVVVVAGIGVSCAGALVLGDTAFFFVVLLLEIVALCVFFFETFVF
jgi:hypothetical protein